MKGGADERAVTTNFISDFPLVGCANTSKIQEKKAKNGEPLKKSIAYDCKLESQISYGVQLKS